jgi:hypothetical protein
MNDKSTYEEWLKSKLDKLEEFRPVSVEIFHQVGHEKPIAFKVETKPVVYLSQECAHDLMVQLTQALNDYHLWLQSQNYRK